MGFYAKHEIIQMNKRDKEKPVFEIIKDLGKSSLYPGNVVSIKMTLRKNLIELKDRIINFSSASYEGEFYEIKDFQ